MRLILSGRLVAGLRRIEVGFPCANHRARDGAAFVSGGMINSIDSLYSGTSIKMKRETQTPTWQVAEEPTVVGS